MPTGHTVPQAEGKPTADGRNESVRFEARTQVPTNPDTLTVCPGCDMIIASTPIVVPYGSQLICPRCKQNVRTPKKDSVNRTMALSLTGLLLYIPAHFLFLLTLEVLGLHDHGSVFDSIKALYQQRYFFVSLMVLLTGLTIPLIKLGLLFVLSLGISQRRFGRHLPPLMRWYHHLDDWGMSEVYLIGILVTIIKMGHTTHITYNMGFFCFIGLVAATIGSSITLDKHLFWQRIEAINLNTPKNTPATTANTADPVMQTAMSVGLMQCRTCHKVIRYQGKSARATHCTRCGERTDLRIHDSIGTTWALVLTAIILSFPANILAFMEVEFLNVPKRSTIMDGIIYFFQDGSYGIGLIILTASILVPAFKVVGLMILLLSIHLKRLSSLAQKSIMFRFIEFIGRWSMLDIFVLALLSSLVNFGFFTTIRSAAAAPFFTGVVLATMFAAGSFDPRLLWDTTAPSPSAHKV